jgi:hypothetical protein
VTNTSERPPSMPAAKAIIVPSGVGGAGGGDRGSPQDEEQGQEQSGCFMVSSFSWFGNCSA